MINYDNPILLDIVIFNLSNITITPPLWWTMYHITWVSGILQAIQSKGKNDNIYIYFNILSNR